MARTRRRDRSSRRPTGRERVSIRPGVTVLSVLRHLNYRPWFALGEFVDNSIQSFLDYRSELQDADSDEAKLRVEIQISPEDGGRITVRDNAAGIHEQDFPRAFRPAELPPDQTGLCEFGMGMKSAACWFSPTWEVRTSALGEPVERTVAFDIARIVRDEIEELGVAVRRIGTRSHFTEIVLRNLHRTPAGRTLGKIREHLADIYRVFKREGILALSLNGEELTYEAPRILVAPFYNANKEPQGDSIEWRKEIDFDFGHGLRAHGFAAVRRTASTSRAGFALFRRRRLVQGSGDEGYRPVSIFGRPNDFAYQRIFGELHLEGFDVTHTKDGFRWDENEEPFLQLLKEELSGRGMPILQQVRNYRVRATRRQLNAGATRASQRTARAIREHVPPVLEEISQQPSSVETPPHLQDATTASRRVIDVELHGRPWRIVLELSDDPAVGDWLEISDSVVSEEAPSPERRVLGLRVSLVHPFMDRFAGADAEHIEALLRVAAALGLAEVAARDAGVRMAGVVRGNVNELLRNALWRVV